MSRNNIKALEEEINFLKITIQHFNNENIEMKNQIEDLKITLNSDKRLLQEYLLQISHKDSTVIKLNHTVEQLKKRLDNLEPQQFTKKNNRISTPERDRTDSNNLKTRHVGNISIKSTKIEQPRSLSVLKSRKITGETIENKIDIIKKVSNKIKPNKISKIKNIQEKVKLEIMQTKHKLDLIQHMYLRAVEKLKQGKKLTSVVLYDEKEDLLNKKIIQNNISINDIIKKNYDNNKEKAIIFMDDKDQIWEIQPQPHLTEEILKEGNYKYLKCLEEVDINNNEYNSEEKEKENNIINKIDEIEDEDDIEISLNNSFYNEQNVDYYEDDFYMDNETKNINNNDIMEESQESNIANIGDFQTEYK